jgi:2-polyprenyl-6-methoxyphenol hydroxylase-like FAD-dependent oxidoreductase
MYDAIVVGARVAGAPTAMLLARKGYRVLLVDRDSFPSDIMSTHYIHQPGVRSLERWGLLDRLLETGCPPITNLRLDYGPAQLEGWPAPKDATDRNIALCPRRKVLDTLLVRAAAEAGAEVREGFSLQEVVFDGDRVRGIRGHSKGGQTVEEQASVVIGADGVHSLVARAVHPEEYNVVPSLGAGYYSYFSGVPFNGVELQLRERAVLFAFPTHDEQTCIAVEVPNSEFHTFRADIEGYFNRMLQEAPAFAERVQAGHREERFVGTGDVPNYYRKPFGPGWALVGDAGYHKDPVTGQGILDSFRDAELLANALDAGFSGKQPAEETLADYQQQRDRATVAIYQMTCQMASFQPSPEQQMLIQALAGNQEDTNRFLGLLGGAEPLEQFMAPENIMGIIARAQARLAAAD